MTTTSVTSGPVSDESGEPVPGARPAPGDAVVVEAIERLLAEFPALSRTVVTAVVRGSGQDLCGAPPGALAELVERLARQRLSDSLTADTKLDGPCPDTTPER